MSKTQILLLFFCTFVIDPLRQDSDFQETGDEKKREGKFTNMFISLIHGIINGKYKQIILSSDLAYKRLE